LIEQEVNKLSPWIKNEEYYYPSPNVACLTPFQKGDSRIHSSPHLENSKKKSSLFINKKSEAEDLSLLEISPILHKEKQPKVVNNIQKKKSGIIGKKDDDVNLQYFNKLLLLKKASKEYQNAESLTNNCNGTGKLKDDNVFHLIKNKKIDIREKNRVLDDMLKQTNKEKNKLYSNMKPGISQIKIQNICKLIKNDDENINSFEKTPNFNKHIEQIKNNTKRQSTIVPTNCQSSMLGKCVENNPNYGEYSFKNLKLKIFKASSEVHTLESCSNTNSNKNKDNNNAINGNFSNYVSKANTTRNNNHNNGVKSNFSSYVDKAFTTRNNNNNNDEAFQIEPPKLPKNFVIKTSRHTTATCSKIDIISNEFLKKDELIYKVGGDSKKESVGDLVARKNIKVFRQDLLEKVKSESKCVPRNSLSIRK